MISPDLARCAAIALGAAAAVDIVYIDCRYRKIPNRHLAVLGLAAACAYAVLAFNPGTPAGFCRAAGLQAAWAAAAALALWRLGLWPAGDAKLFMLLSALLPVAAPESLRLSWRLPLVSLINIFLPAAFFVLLRALGWVWGARLKPEAGFLRSVGLRRLPDYLLRAREDMAAALRKAGREWWRDLAPADTAALAALGAALCRGPASTISLFLLWQALRGALDRRVFWSLFAFFALAAARFATAAGLGPGEFLRGFSSWLLFMASANIGMAAVKVFFGVRERFMALAGIALMFVPLALGGAPRWVFWGAACGLGYKLVASFLDEDLWVLPLNALRPNLVPAPATLDLLRGDPEFYEEHFGRIYPDGLTAGQTDALREWCRGRALESVAFKRTLPFAFWIFLGAGLTFFMKADVLTLALGWARHG